MRIDFDILIKQVIPPHWRGTWRENMMRTLIEPIAKDYEEFTSYINNLPSLVNLNAQRLCIEYNLNRIAGYINRTIFCGDGPNHFFKVNVPAGTDRAPLIEYLERYVPDGKFYEIIEY